MTGTGNIGAVDSPGPGLAKKKKDKDRKKGKGSKATHRRVQYSEEAAIRNFAAIVLEGDDPEHDDLRAYADRLALRIFENPSLMSYLNDIQLDHEKQAVEMDFFAIPDNEVENLKRLIGIDHADIKLYKFRNEGRQHLGVRVLPYDLSDEDSSEDFSSTGYSPSPTAATI